MAAPGWERSVVDDGSRPVAAAGRGLEAGGGAEQHKGEEDNREHSIHARRNVIAIVIRASVRQILSGYDRRVSFAQGATAAG